MKIRITGTEYEIEQVTELLKHKEYVRNISPMIKNKGEYNKDYRVYIETYDNPELLHYDAQRAKSEGVTK